MKKTRPFGATCRVHPDGRPTASKFLLPGVPLPPPVLVDPVLRVGLSVVSLSLTVLDLGVVVEGGAGAPPACSVSAPPAEPTIPEASLMDPAELEPSITESLLDDLSSTMWCLLFLFS